MIYQSVQRNVGPRCEYAPSGPEFSKATVFIVDDDWTVRDALSLLLKSVGLNTETYPSGQAFLDAYNPNRNGCLIVDVHMPDMTGLELQAKLAACKISIPVILITGNADVPMAIRAFKAGAVDLFEKPFNSQALLKRIREILASNEPTGGTLPSATQESLYQERERVQLALAAMGDGLIITTASGIIDYLNPIAESLTGWCYNEARGRPLQEVFNSVDEATRKAVINTGIQRILIRRDGQELAIDHSMAPIRDHQGNTLGAVIVFRDVTQARMAARCLFYHATHDPLTGLINRREFEHRLERVLASTQEDNREHALCYLDFDRFKLVNDAVGHSAGDQLLRQLSELLYKQMRQRDTLARLGGDEFAALLEHCPLEQALRIANDLRRAVEHFHFVWEGQRLGIGVSIGVTTITIKSTSMQEVLHAADIACYKAKQQGRNRIFYSQQPNSA